jgi:hypothetical protein
VFGNDLLLEILKGKKQDDEFTLIFRNKNKTNANNYDTKSNQSGKQNETARK